jgi:hypothetical protein
VKRALEIVSRIEQLGGCLAVDPDGTIRFRLPKDNPEANSGRTSKGGQREHFGLLAGEPFYSGDPMHW